MSAKNFLHNLTIPSPCSADWNSMIGNNQVRFCEHCHLDVHDLSQLTRSQAERLIARSNGRVCVRYHQDEKAGQLTLPVSQKLHRIGRRVSRIAAGAFTATLSVSSAVAQQTVTLQGRVLRVPTTSQPLTLSASDATIAGTIKDLQGAVISGATISLWDEKLGSPLYATSDDNGQFKVENLASGSYRVRIEAPGYTAQESQINASRNNEARVDSVLQAEAIEETVPFDAVNLVMITGGAASFVAPADPLIQAAQQDDLETVAALIAGRDVNQRDEQSETTALEHAVRNANREMVQLLISAGAKVNAKNDSGETVLMMIDGEATSDLIWDLINAGADVNAKDDNEDTALINVANVDNLEAVKALIEAGAKINDQNKSGVSALMRAASEGYVNIVRALVIAGADINAVDEDGENALSLALENAHPAVVRYLKSRGAVEVVTAKAEEEE